MPRQNYRHLKKQKEESRKARQAEKKQRRQMRASEASTEDVGGATPADSTAPSRTEGEKPGE